MITSVILYIFMEPGIKHQTKTLTYTMHLPLQQLKWNKLLYLCFFKPRTPIWGMKDLAAGQRLIPTSQMSRIFTLTSLQAVLLLYLGKSFILPCQSEPVMGDGRQEHALNKPRFKAAALGCHSLERDGRERERDEANSEGDAGRKERQRFLFK